MSVLSSPLSAMTPELARRHSNTVAVLELFKSRPNEWIDWKELAQVGGALAWRTRVADARRIVKAEGGRIENRQQRTRSMERDDAGMPVRLYIGHIVSEYRYLEHRPIGPSAETYREQRLFT